MLKCVSRFSKILLALVLFATPCLSAWSQGSEDRGTITGCYAKPYAYNQSRNNLSPKCECLKDCHTCTVNTDSSSADEWSSDDFDDPSSLTRVAQTGSDSQKDGDESEDEHSGSDGSYWGYCGTFGYPDCSDSSATSSIQGDAPTSGRSGSGHTGGPSGFDDTDSLTCVTQQGDYCPQPEEGTTLCDVCVYVDKDIQDKIKSNLLKSINDYQPPARSGFSNPSPPMPRLNEQDEATVFENFTKLIKSQSVNIDEYKNENGNLNLDSLAQTLVPKTWTINLAPSGSDLVLYLKSIKVEQAVEDVVVEGCLKCQAEQTLENGKCYSNEQRCQTHANNYNTQTKTCENCAPRCTECCDDCLVTSHGIEIKSLQCEYPKSSAGYHCDYEGDNPDAKNCTFKGGAKKGTGTCGPYGYFLHGGHDFCCPRTLEEKEWKIRNSVGGEDHTWLDKLGHCQGRKAPFTSDFQGACYGKEDSCKDLGGSWIAGENTMARCIIPKAKATPYLPHKICIKCDENLTLKDGVCVENSVATTDTAAEDLGKVDDEVRSEIGKSLQDVQKQIGPYSVFLNAGDAKSDLLAMLEEDKLKSALDKLLQIDSYYPETEDPNCKDGKMIDETCYSPAKTASVDHLLSLIKGNEKANSIADGGSKTFNNIKSDNPALETMVLNINEYEGYFRILKFLQSEEANEIIAEWGCVSMGGNCQIIDFCDETETTDNSTDSYKICKGCKQGLKLVSGVCVVENCGTKGSGTTLIKGKCYKKDYIQDDCPGMSGCTKCLPTKATCENCQDGFKLSSVGELTQAQFADLFLQDSDQTEKSDEAKRKELMILEAFTPTVCIKPDPRIPALEDQLTDNEDAEDLGLSPGCYPAADYKAGKSGNKLGGEGCTACTEDCHTCSPDGKKCYTKSGSCEDDTCSICSSDDKTCFVKKGSYCLLTADSLGCLTCLQSNNSQCITCKPGYESDNGKCKKSSAVPTPSQETDSCSSPTIGTSTCKTCVTPASGYDYCTSCDTERGHTLRNGTCYTKQQDQLANPKKSCCLEHEVMFNNRCFTAKNNQSVGAVDGGDNPFRYNDRVAQKITGDPKAKFTDGRQCPIKTDMEIVNDYMGDIRNKCQRVGLQSQGFTWDEATLTCTNPCIINLHKTLNLKDNAMPKDGELNYCDTTKGLDKTDSCVYCIHGFRKKFLNDVCCNRGDEKCKSTVTLLDEKIKQLDVTPGSKSGLYSCKNKDFPPTLSDLYDPDIKVGNVKDEDGNQVKDKDGNKVIELIDNTTKSSSEQKNYCRCQSLEWALQSKAGIIAYLELENDDRHMRAEHRHCNATRQLEGNAWNNHEGTWNDSCSMCTKGFYKKGGIISKHYCCVPGVDHPEGSCKTDNVLYQRFQDSICTPDMLDDFKAEERFETGSTLEKINLIYLLNQCPQLQNIKLSNETREGILYDYLKIYHSQVRKKVISDNAAKSKGQTDYSIKIVHRSLSTLLYDMCQDRSLGDLECLAALFKKDSLVTDLLGDSNAKSYEERLREDKENNKQFLRPVIQKSCEQHGWKWQSHTNGGYICNPPEQ